ncbi:S41 family peptidase [Winogradskyella sp.]|uniref:S41 family peptidase n=1 Tax=Winogradskyella sp. TaxID=1883156 RepID=UPI003F6AA0AD
MKKIKTLLLICVTLFLVTSCFEDLDDNVSFSNTEVKDFVWKGMNAVYLYKSDIPDLANDRFSSDDQYNDYLDSFETPEEIFESVKYLPESVDRFSRIFSNYFDFQNQQQGITLTNGLEFNLYLVPGSETEVFGAITLVLNNSVADNLGLERGEIFRAVDGVALTTSNLNQLLNQDTYTINFADYDTNGTNSAEDDTVTINGDSTSLTAAEYTENPVHIVDILNVDDTLIGYLMYNGFNSSFNGALNNAFGTFQSGGIEELVIDLRYNGGGSVQTAAYLASMITGQYNGDVFSKLFYNENLDELNRDYLFTDTIDNVGQVNSLNLSKVYIITTNRRTASASEALINGLNPYIEVVVIGENTVGKTQSSLTVYDSPGLFTTEGVNPNHTYAMQPLVANSTNSNEALVPSTGLSPDIPISETPSTFESLGSISEPLLREAIIDITGSLGRFYYEQYEPIREVRSSVQLHPLEQDMYIEY